MTARWLRQWEQKPATITAFKLLGSVGGSASHLSITRREISRACWCAAHYDPKCDPGEIYRAQMAAEKKKLKQLQKAAHILALSSARNDKGLSWAHDIAESASGVRITRKDHSTPKAQHLVMQDYFSHLETALKGKLPELHCGPFLHRFTKGNLIFDKPISSGRPYTVETMLAFELAFYLRMHIAGRAEDGLQNGQLMPSDGEPCFWVVAAFCAAVFGTSWDAKQIGDNVQALTLKSVGLRDWQGVNSD
jgi:hypothetical protein